MSDRSAKGRILRRYESFGVTCAVDHEDKIETQQHNQEENQQAYHQI
jgi:hypothetical protein